MDWLRLFFLRRWLKSSRQKFTDLAIPPFELNVLSINHSNYGIERFSIGASRCNLDTSDPKIAEFVVAVSAGSSLKRSNALENIGPPFFEATILLVFNTPSLQIGTLLMQKEGYDQKRGNLSNFYYFTHENVDDFTFEVVGITPSHIEAKITGSTLVCGPVQDAKFSLHTSFSRDSSLRRGIQ